MIFAVHSLHVEAVARIVGRAELMMTAPSPEIVAHKLDVLRRHCDEVGRDFAQIQKTIISGIKPPDDADAFLASMAEYARLGVDLVEVSPVGPDPAGWVGQVVDQVVPRLGELAGPVAT